MYVEDFWGVCWPYVKGMLGLCWVNIEGMLGVCWGKLWVWWGNLGYVGGMLDVFFFFLIV